MATYTPKPSKTAGMSAYEVEVIECVGKATGLPLAKMNKGQVLLASRMAYTVPSELRTRAATCARGWLVSQTLELLLRAEVLKLIGEDAEVRAALRHTLFDGPDACAKLLDSLKLRVCAGES